jgi:hypothetical protein
MAHQRQDEEQRQMDRQDDGGTADLEAVYQDEYGDDAWDGSKHPRMPGHRPCREGDDE